MNSLEDTIESRDWFVNMNTMILFQLVEITLERSELSESFTVKNKNIHSYLFCFLKYLQTLLHWCKDTHPHLWNSNQSKLTFILGIYYQTFGENEQALEWLEICYRCVEGVGNDVEDIKQLAIFNSIMIYLSLGQNERV